VTENSQSTFFSSPVVVFRARDHPSPARSSRPVTSVAGPLHSCGGDFSFPAVVPANHRIGTHGRVCQELEPWVNVVASSTNGNPIEKL